MGIEYLILGASGIGGLIGWIRLERWLDSRPPKGAFIDPRSDTDKFFNDLGYHKGVDYCKNAELFPKTVFGKIAAHYDYYKRKDNIN